MPAPLSTHLPGISGGIIEIVGEDIVDTGMRDVQTFVATMQTTNFAADQESKVGWYPLPNDEAWPTRRMVIRLEKGGANEGLPGDNPVMVSWLALGR